MLTSKGIFEIKSIENLTSHDKVPLGCVRCGSIREIKVMRIRYYVNTLSRKEYVCHSCKVKENGKAIGRKLAKKAKDSGRTLHSDIITRECSVCKSKITLKYRNYLANKRRNDGRFSCQSCSGSRAHKEGKFDGIYTPEFKKKLSESSSTFWRNMRGNWRDFLVTDDFRKQMSEYGKMPWLNPEYKKKMAKLSSDRNKLLFSDPEWVRKWKETIPWERIAKKSREMWRDDVMRKKASLASKKRWQDPEYRDKMLEIINSSSFREKMAIIRLHQPRTSLIQKVFYSMLADLGIEYHDDTSEMCKVGYYIWDCRIDPQKSLGIHRPLLIDINGDYWHSLPHTVSKDRSKATFTKRYHPKYDIKYIWEHEFDNQDRVMDTIRYWLNIGEVKKTDFEFKDVVIRPVDVDEATLFVGKYHYSGRLGKRGTYIGFYCDEILIGVVCYGPLTRKESADKQGFKPKEMLELTRLCIHPSYQKKNFASFMISRSIKAIKSYRSDIKCLITFADLTFNHHGTIYKASNWRLDGIVKPSYWYVDHLGYVCHKKTLWNKASKMRMPESEYCEKFGYHKVWGYEKKRFIYYM